MRWFCRPRPGRLPPLCPTLNLCIFLQVAYYVSGTFLILTCNLTSLSLATWTGQPKHYEVRFAISWIERRGRIFTGPPAPHLTGLSSVLGQPA